MHRIGCALGRRHRERLRLIIREYLSMSDDGPLIEDAVAIVPVREFHVKDPDGCLLFFGEPKAVD